MLLIFVVILYYSSAVILGIVKIKTYLVSILIKYIRSSVSKFNITIQIVVFLDKWWFFKMVHNPSCRYIPEYMFSSLWHRTDSLVLINTSYYCDLLLQSPFWNVQELLPVLFVLFWFWTSHRWRGPQFRAVGKWEYSYWQYRALHGPKDIEVGIYVSNHQNH